MKAAVSRLLLAGCVLGSAASPAAGQTGRIAHLGHGGSAVALAGEEKVADNFGIVPVPPRIEWKTDTLTYLNDSVAAHSGLARVYYRSGSGKTNWSRQVEEIYYAGTARLLASPYSGVGPLDSLRKYYPHTVFIGFDKPKKPLRRKPAGRSQAFPKRPFQYSYWRELAGAAGLGAMGWLLGKNPKAKVG